MYGEADERESVATIHRAIDLGLTLFDTAEIDGPLKNEALPGRALRGKRDGVVIATRFGFRYDGKGMRGVDSAPADVRRAADRCFDTRPPAPTFSSVDAVHQLLQPRRDQQ